MASSWGPRLLQQGEKILLHEIHPHLLSYCPTMDLIAIVTKEENLDVYRMNGQRVFGLKRKNPSVTVDCICWQFNGQAIAVAWSDGCTDILSSETGKVIHPNVTTPKRDSDIPRIRTIGWGLNFINAESVKKRIGAGKGKPNGKTKTLDFDSLFSADMTTDDWDAFGDDTTIEDFLQRQPDLSALDIAPDLPDQLVMLDIEALFPKLPLIPLPPATPFMRPQADAGAFSSQAQVDSLLHSHQSKDHNSVDMFIRCTEDGTVHPSIYDSLETVNIRLPSEWAVDSSKPVLHTSHPYSCSHGLLTEVKRGSQSSLAFIPLTLGFIPSAGIYLHLIASKSSQLQNLLLYIQQCLQRLRTYFKHSKDLPSKFMLNLSETLAEKGQMDLVQSLYHLSCTGHCPEPLKEWLVDELQESGHKRWDNTVVSSLTAVIQLLHENLLPAIDRCASTISRLRGLAEYNGPEWIFNTPVSDFTKLLDLLKNLRHLGHVAMKYAVDEKRQFLSFSKWLRYEIDYEATEPGSQSRVEMESRDPGVDISVVLDYIQYGLTRSELTCYFQTIDELPEVKKDAAPSTYMETVEAIKLAKESGHPTYKPEALCFEHVLQHFHAGCTKLFQAISHWQKNNISMNSGIILESDVELTGKEALDIRMLSEPQPHPDENQISTYALFSPPSSSNLHIHRLTHSATITSLPSSLHTYAITTIDFPTATLLDATFADDTTLLTLLRLHDEDSTHVIAFLPFTSLSYTPLPSSSYPSTTLPTGSPIPESSRTTITMAMDEVKAYTRHVFEPRFTPLKLVVNGRKGRRVAIVLGSDRKHFRILDLDHAEKKSGKKGEGGGGDEDEDTGGDESAGNVEDIDMDDVD